MSLTNIQDINNEVILQLNDDTILKLAKNGELIDNNYWIRRFVGKYGASLRKYKVNHEKLYKEWKGKRLNDVFIEASKKGYLEVVKYFSYS